MSDDSALRAEFDRFDHNKNGHIDEDEFSSLVEALGGHLTRSEAAVFFLAIDVNGNRRIEFSEFATWWKKYKA